MPEMLKCIAGIRISRDQVDEKSRTNGFKGTRRPRESVIVSDGKVGRPTRNKVHGLAFITQT